MSKNTKNTQLTPAQGYNPKKRMIFLPPNVEYIPDSKIEYKRINILTENEDGTQGELILPTERCFSFGVSENISPDTKKVTGWTFPICLWSKDGVTDPEKAWVETFNSIVDTCIDHVLDVKEEIDMYELQRSDLTKSKGGMNPLYWKKEKITDEKTGKTILRKVEGTGPMLYPKLIFKKKTGNFLTKIFNMDDEPLDPLSLMNDYWIAEAAIKIESIFIGATGKIALQIKLYEAVVEPAGGTMKRLLSRPKANSKVLAAKESSKTASAVMNDNDDDDQSADENGSLNNASVESGEEAESAPKKSTKAPAKKLTVKRAVKRVAK